MRKFFNRLYFLLSGILLVIMVFSLTACSSTKTLEPAPEGYSFIKPPSEEQIYSRFGNSKMYMTTDPEQIADWYCDFVVIGKFLGNTDTFVANGDHIYTKGLFEVTDVLKGDYAGQYLEAVYGGGAISVDEYLDALEPGEISSYGLNKIPQNERSSLYVEERDPEYGVDPTPGTTYILLLSDSDIGYAVQGDTFGVMPYQDGKAYDYATNSYKTFSFME